MMLRERSLRFRAVRDCLKTFLVNKLLGVLGFDEIFAQQRRLTGDSVFSKRDNRSNTPFLPGGLTEQTGEKRDPYFHRYF